MSLRELDTAAVARAFAGVSSGAEDPSEVFFETLRDVQYTSGEGPPELACRVEQGFSVRLTRGGRSWMASRDAIRGRELVEALRQVARSLPSGFGAEPVLEIPPATFDRPEALLEQGAALTDAIRARHAAFPLRLSILRRQREVRVVGARLVGDTELEAFYSLRAETPWGVYGNLETALDAPAIERLAAFLVERFRDRLAAVPPLGELPLVLSPQATAVLLHEAVAHALEVDTLARSGKAEAAVGLRLGGPAWNVLDDPGGAPEAVRRTSDDEGQPVRRRWLLREGVVEEPLADARSAHGSAVLSPGAGRRASRHHAPAPRSHHLELVPGAASADELLRAADGGLYASVVTRGRLDPASGEFRLTVAGGHQIHGGERGEAVGPFELHGSIAGLLSAEVLVGAEAQSCGAGWCAKEGHLLPVWAKCPALFVPRMRICGVD
jgi:predicted Zn-dependent protease